MSTVLDQELPPPPADALPVGASDEQWPIAQPTAPAEAPKRRSGGHIAAMVIGIVMILPSLGALLGGTALLVARGTTTDEGFFDLTLDRIRSDGVAVTSIDLWDAADDPDDPVVLDWLDVEVRLAVEGAGPTDEVFVGIARTEDVLDYLDGTEYSEAVEFDGRQPRYVEMAGRASIAEPGSTDIWDASAEGTGEQELTWEARSGDWSVVVMNADGSADVAADVEVGVRSDALTTIAIVMLVLGAIGVVVGTILIVIGARGRR